MLNLADNLLEHIDQAAFEPLKRLKGKKHALNKYDQFIQNAGWMFLMFLISHIRPILAQFIRSAKVSNVYIRIAILT